MEEESGFQVGIFAGTAGTMWGKDVLGGRPGRGTSRSVGLGGQRRGWTTVQEGNQQPQISQPVASSGYKVRWVREASQSPSPHATGDHPCPNCT